MEFWNHKNRDEFLWENKIRHYLCFSSLVTNIVRDRKQWRRVITMILLIVITASGQEYKYFINRDLSFSRRHLCPHFTFIDFIDFLSRLSFQLFSSESILFPPLNFRIYIHILFLFLPRKETSSFVSFSFSESPLDPSAPQRGRKKLVSI